MAQIQENPLVKFAKNKFSTKITNFPEDNFKKLSFARSPTLQTVLMVERFIEKNSAEYTYTEVWKKLPKKVMWQTYLVILDYLQSINKIAFDRNGAVEYIWNPELAKKLKNRKSY